MIRIITRKIDLFDTDKKMFIWWNHHSNTLACSMVDGKGQCMYADLIPWQYIQSCRQIVLSSVLCNCGH